MTVRKKEKVSCANGILLVGLTGFILPNNAYSDAGIFMTPSLSVTKIYDNNLFYSTSDPVEDELVRTVPVIATGYRSNNAFFQGIYSTDIERYEQHTELDSNRAREQSSLNYRYTQSRALSLSFDADYIKTRSPAELSPETGLQLGRTMAERKTADAFLSYQFDQNIKGIAGFEFVRDEIFDQITYTNTAALQLDTKVNRRNTLNYRYEIQQIRFDGNERINSYSLTGGNTYEQSHRTTVSVSVGLRITDDDVDPDLSASIVHKLQRGDISAEYSREQTTILGFSDTVSRQSLSAKLSQRLTKNLIYDISPSYRWTTYFDTKSENYGLDVGVGYRVTRYLSLVAYYDYSYQKGNLTDSDADNILREEFGFGLVIDAPGFNYSMSRAQIPTPTSIRKNTIPFPAEQQDIGTSPEEDK